MSVFNKYILRTDDGVDGEKKDIPIISMNYIQTIFTVDNDYNVEIGEEFIGDFLSKRKVNIIYQDNVNKTETVILYGYASQVNYNRSGGGSIISLICSPLSNLLRNIDANISVDYAVKTCGDFLALVERANLSKSFGVRLVTSSPKKDNVGSIKAEPEQNLIDFLTSYANKNSLLIYSAIEDGGSVLKLEDIEQLFFKSKQPETDFDIISEEFFNDFDGVVEEVEVKPYTSFLTTFNKEVRGGRGNKGVVVSADKKQSALPRKRKVIMIRSGYNSSQTKNYANFVMKFDSIQRTYYKITTTTKPQLGDIIGIPTKFGVGNAGVVGYIACNVNPENSLYEVYIYPKDVIKEKDAKNK